MASTLLVPGWPWVVDDQRLRFGGYEMRGADLATFRPLNEWWGRDARRVYCAGSAIKDADVETFRVLNAIYAKDARRAYTVQGVIREVEDVATFEAAGPTEHAFCATNGYAKDARHVYHAIEGGKACVMKGADAGSFAARGNGYGADKSAVYYERKKIAGADPNHWQHVRGPHSRSEKKAYILGKRIRVADGNSLESLPILEISEYWCRDARGYFRWDEPGDPEAYLKVFRQCFIFRGKVSKIALSGDRDEPLDPTRPESWAIARHAWIFVDCQEWIQKPDVEVVEAPRLGEPYKFGKGTHLELLAAPDWREEDRIWIFVPGEDSQGVEKRLVLRSARTWWEYSSLDQLDSIRKTIAAASA